MSNVTSNTQVLADARDAASTPWGVLRALTGTVVAYFGASLLAQLCSPLVRQFATWTVLYVPYSFRYDIAGQFWIMMFAEMFVLGILWLFIRQYPQKLWLKGIGLRCMRWADVGAMLIGILAYYGVYTFFYSVASQLFHLNSNHQQELGFDNVTGTANLVLVGLSLVIIPPLVEEILFRGFLFGGLRKRLNFGIAVIITSILFAIPHAAENSKVILWNAALDTFSLSLVLCYLREKTGAIYAGIGLHAIKNGMAFVSLFILHVR